MIILSYLKDFKDVRITLMEKRPLSQVFKLGSRTVRKNMEYATVNVVLLDTFYPNNRKGPMRSKLPKHDLP